MTVQENKFKSFFIIFQSFASFSKIAQIRPKWLQTKKIGHAGQDKN